MKLTQRIIHAIRAARRSWENPYTPLSDAMDSWEDYGGGGTATSGVKINRVSALKYPAVWRAVSLISRDVGKLPLLLYRRLEEGGKERYQEHPAYKLLRRSSNPQMTSKTVKTTLTAHAVLQGNGYAWIDRDGAGRPLELWPLLPEDTWPVRVNGALWYVTTVGAEQLKLLPENVLHIKGLSHDGMAGYSVLSQARDSLGLGLAAATYGARFFQNDATPRVIFEFPGRMDQQAQEEFKRAWNSLHQGLDNSHKTALITNGGKLTKWSIDARDAQLLETRQFEIREIANWFGVPPHKLGDNSKASYNSLEQENQSYLDDALDPWLCEWEEECYSKLLTAEERQSESVVVEFLRQALVRANLTERYGAYNLALTGGWMNRDEIRERENMNPIPGGEGKEFLVALNLGSPGGNPDVPQAEADIEDEPADEEEPDEEAPARSAHRRLLEDAYRRAVKRLTTHAAKAAKSPAALEKLADHLPAVAEILEPALAAAAALGYHAEDRQPEMLLGAVRRTAAAALAAGPPEEAASRLEAAAEMLLSDVPHLIETII